MLVDQLFNPKPLKEGGPYDLPGIDYPRPGDAPRKRPSGEHNPYPYSQADDEAYFREIFRKKREAAKKAEQDKQQGVAEGPFLPDGPGGVQKGIGGTAKYGMGLADKRNMGAKNPAIQNDLQAFKSWLNGGPKPADINDMLTGVDTYFTNIEVPSDARVATALKQVLTAKAATPQLAQILTPAVDVAIKAPIRNSAAGQQNYLHPTQASQQAQTQPVAMPVPVPGQPQQAAQAPRPGAAPAASAPAGKKFNTAGATTVTPRPVTRPALPMPRLREQGMAEGLPQTLRKVVPGHAKREIDKKMDAGKFGKTDADKDANFHRYKKIQDKIKEQGVAEGSMYGDEEVSWEKGGRRAPTGAFRNPAAEKIDQANKILDNPNSSPDMKKAAASILGQEQMLLRQYKDTAARRKQGMAETEQQKGADYRDPPEADYGDEYQAMVKRVGQKGQATRKI
jgi:hypothetical protein